jgi:hypothetical protein
VGVSCMILHSSIKTHAEKQDERIQAQLKQERARIIEALQEAAPIKASSLPPPPCSGPVGLDRIEYARLTAPLGRLGPPCCEPAGSGLHCSTARYDGSAGRVGLVGHSGARPGHPSRIRLGGQQTSSLLAGVTRLAAIRPAQTGQL